MRINNFILIFLLALISFGVYSNSLEGDFLIDDQAGILDNESIQDPALFFSKHFNFHLGVAYELTRVLSWRIGGDKPFFYHLFNVAAHSGCVILLFILCSLLFNDKRLSFLAALIFAIHPIHTEAVSWMSGGHYAFSSLFFIAAFIFYIKSKKSTLNLIFAITAFVICLFSGNTAASLPLILIFYELLFKPKTAGGAVVDKFRLLVLGSIVVISFIFIFRHFVNRNEFVHLIFYFRGFSYLIVAVKAFIYYLKILYLPIQRGLYHPFAFNTTDVQNISPAFFLSIAALSVMIIVFIRCRRNLKPVSFGIGWFLITYLPYSNIIPICNIISERYLYLPSVGFAVAIAALFLKVWEVVNKNIKYKTVLRYISIGAITLFLSSYAYLTVKRNYEYHNIVTYWQTNINNFSDGHLVYNNLAATYYAMGKLDNAIYYCGINLMIDPNQPHVWCNMGKVYREMGNLKQAKDAYSQTLKIDKNYYPAIKAMEEMK